jgi:hypothetical protein
MKPLHRTKEVDVECIEQKRERRKRKERRELVRDKEKNKKKKYQTKGRKGIDM